MAEPVVSGEDIEHVLTRWPAGKVLEVSSDSVGTINWTWLITADSGRYALQLCCHSDAGKVQRVCDLITYAVGAGQPAIQPIMTHDGSRYLEEDGRLWLLSPFAPGFQTDRKAMSLDQDRGLGRGLAKLLEALAGCPESLGRSKSLEVQVDQSLEKIDRMLERVRAHPDQSKYEDYALHRLTGQRQWIEDHADATTNGLKELPFQVIHGDFQEKNVFFDQENEVSAIIDWDNSWSAPREWEIIRTLNFVIDFEPERGRAFVEAYTEQADLDLEALDRAAWAYGVLRTLDLWMYEQIYIEGSERVRRFQRPGSFIPIYDRWIPLRDALKAPR